MTVHIKWQNEDTCQFPSNYISILFRFNRKKPARHEWLRHKHADLSWAAEKLTDQVENEQVHKEVHRGGADSEMAGRRHADGRRRRGWIRW